MNTIRKERLQSLARSLEVACEKIDEVCDTTAVLKCFAICISDLAAIVSPAEPAEPTPAETLTRRDQSAAQSIPGAVAYLVAPDMHEALAALADEYDRLVETNAVPAARSKEIDDARAVLAAKGEAK